MCGTRLRLGGANPLAPDGGAAHLLRDFLCHLAGGKPERQNGDHE